MEPDCDQKMAFLSTMKPVASYNHHVGTRKPPKTKTSSILTIKGIPSIPGIQRMVHVGRVRRSIELLDSVSLENLRLEILKQSHDAFTTEFKRIFHEGQQCLDLAADVSDLGDELLMEFA